MVGVAIWRHFASYRTTKIHCWSHRKMRSLFTVWAWVSSKCLLCGIQASIDSLTLVSAKQVWDVSDREAFYKPLVCFQKGKRPRKKLPTDIFQSKISGIWNSIRIKVDLPKFCFHGKLNYPSLSAYLKSSCNLCFPKITYCRQLKMHTLCFQDVLF